ncbi:hypothetical protein AB0B01_11725 [Streptomyces sp. NPDC044571]|uniref:hypothetical protein n=1 Tax=Streptomyces sp. NPDC044571 TaxID=3155371 RepID=UPI0033E79A12
MSRTGGASAPTTPSPSTASVRFGMAHAFVITAFLAAAVILSLTAHMAVQDILILLGGAGSVSVAVLISANIKTGGKGSGGGLLRRLLNAALTNGSGN